MEPSPALELLVDEQPLACNQAVIIGELVTEPERRTLPGGTELVAFSLTVRQAGRATTSVPLVWYDPPKRVDRWKLGSKIVAAGPVVRRFYRAGGATASRTEVAVRKAETVTRRSRASAIIAAVADQVEELVTQLE